MKGYMKKVKAKRMLAMLLSAVMVLSICLPQNVEAGTADDRYKGSSTIQSLLTDFEYVVKGDVTLTNAGHCVGAAAIGGSLTGYNSIGDGAKAPSYAKYIVSGSIGNGQGFVGSTQDFYYGDSDYTLPSGFTQNPDYMDVEGMFPSIISQSEKMAYNSQNTVASYDSSQSSFITVDFTKSNVYNISYDDLYKAEGINVIIDNVDDFSYDAYTINVIGVGANRLDFNCETGYGAVNSSGVDFQINGSFGQFLMNEFRLDQQIASGQSNVAGMKFIWNFPDATDTISWSGMPGHLVAPKAHVEAQNRFEGGVIAASVYANGQAHFFPYGDFQLDESGTTFTPKDIMIQKLYLNQNYVSMTPSEQAQFTLYEDAACTTPIANAENVAVDASTGYVTFDSAALGLECGNTYYVKESKAPKGFDINETVYECVISTGGLVTYKVVGSTAGYSDEAPVCENISKTSTETSGTIFVSVVEIVDGKSVNIKGATVTVESADGTINMSKQTLDSDYAIFPDLPAGDYTVILSTIPEGYDEPNETDREVKVKLDNTAYQTFVLEKSTADVVVNLREGSVDGPIVSGGKVRITGPDGYDRTETVGSTGTLTFETLPVGNYTITLVEIPEGYDGPTSTTVQFTLDKDGYEYTYVLTKQLGTVVVDIVEENTTNNVPGGSVTITLPDGSTRIEEDTDGDGKVTFENVPVGTSKVQITTAPDNYILVNPNPTESVEVIKDGIATATLPVKQETQKGDLTIQVVDTNNSTTCGKTDANKVTIKITASNGKAITKEVYIDDNAISLSDPETYALLAGEYTVEVSTPDGWKTVKTTVDSEAATNPSSVKAEVKDQTITAVVVTVDAVGTLKVIVQEEGSGDVIPGATIKVTDSDGTEYERTTGTDGSFTIENVPVGNVTIEVLDVPDEYEKPTGTKNAEVTQHNITTETIEVNPFGNIVVTVKEQGTDTMISGAVIKVESTTLQETTGSTGKITFEDVALGTYTVTIVSVGEEWTLVAPTEQTVTVTASQDGEAVFEVTKTTGTLTVNVIEKVGGDPVEDAVIKVTDANGTEITIPYNDTTDSEGKVEINNLPIGDYKVTIVSATGNYILPDEKTHDVTVTKDGGETTFELEEPVVADGSLKVLVFVDDGNGNLTPYTTATVDVIGLNGTAIGTLTHDGGISNLPLGKYTTSINTPSGYVLKEGTVAQTKEVYDNQCTTYEYILIKAGEINVTVKDSDNNPVGNITVSVVDKSGNEIITKETKPDGTVTFTDLPIGEYDVEIKDIPEKYDDPETETKDATITVTVDEKDVEFTLPLAGDITVTVYEIGTSNAISGAEVELRDEADNLIGEAKTTDAAGQVFFEDLKDATYKVVITDAPNGYSIVEPTVKPSEVEAVLNEDGRSKEAKFYVDALGNLVFTVVEDGTGNLIPGAKVEIKDSKGKVLTDNVTDEDFFVTSQDGTIAVNDIPAGKYTVTVVEVPTGYKVTTPSEATKTVTVIKNETATEQAKIVATTTLVIKIVDENDDTELLEGSKITVEDQYGNVEEVTATDGTVTLPNWPVTTDPSNPTKVTITKVPSTHVLPTEASKVTTTVVVEKKPAGEVNNHIVEAPQKPTTTGDLIITVRDEETGAIVPGAMVVITYPDGSTETVETDQNGKINRPGVVTGQYSIEVEAVPSGFTKPSKEITKVEVTTDTTEVEVVIKKPVTPPTGSTSGKGTTSTKSNSEVIRKSPKTGDTGYTPIALAMMVISIVGLAGIVVYRKKTENER